MKPATGPHHHGKRRRRRTWPWIIALIWLASSLWQAYKPLPDGIGVAGPWRPASETMFLADRTFLDSVGKRQSEQAIFTEVFAMIGQARRLVLLDMFLFNDFGSEGTGVFRRLSAELTDTLLHRMASVPGLRVVVITDPVNTVYGSVHAPGLDRLQRAGAQIVTTDLARLRASNALWSGPWSLCCAWLGNNQGGGWLPNPFGSEPITLRSWLALPNFRANHRKTLVVDHGNGWQAIVTSANPHDASSAHDNVALRFSGEAALDLIQGEASVAAFSGTTLRDLPRSAQPGQVQADAPRLRILGEGAIRTAVLDAIHNAAAGESLDIAMFYLSEREIVRALWQAQQRGVRMRLLLDPNEDAFGHKKNGIPNRQVAAELARAGVNIRWCDTHGEQCHAKFLLHRTNGYGTLILGSGNFTRRNLGDLNLEMDAQFVAPMSHQAMQDANEWFDEVWFNRRGRLYSIEYARYQDDNPLRRAWYRVGELAGLSTW